MATWHDVCWAESQLLVFGKEIVHIAIEDHAAHRLQGEDVLRPNLCDIKRIELVLHV